MKMFSYKSLTMAAIATMFALAACDNSETTGNGGKEPDDLLITGEITENLTLEKGKEYKLSGGVEIKKGVTLTIQEGVTIVAQEEEVDYILIEQGAKINAQGTAANPIIMTSKTKEPGAWGGLHICGYAPTNIGTVGESEIGEAAYGGDDPADNSGILRYIRLEYTGYAFTDEKESNGVTFYGVGNGTTVEYLQAYKGSDDGFEWFGGTVNAKYLVATDCSDDSFDWTEGWSGKAQYLVAYQGAESEIGYDCDCLIEADNNANNAAATPVSNPTLANLTLIGNSSETNKRGIRLRAGTKAQIYNTLVKGKANCLTTETVETENALVDGESILDYIYIESGMKAAEGIYSETLFTANANNGINQDFSFNKYVGTIAGGKKMSEVDSFFDNAEYKGAIEEGKNWAAGWTL